MDFNSICMSPVDFGTVGVGDMWQGSSQISQQVVQMTAVLFTVFTVICRQ